MRQICAICVYLVIWIQYIWCEINQELDIIFLKNPRTNIKKISIFDKHKSGALSWPYGRCHKDHIWKSRRIIISKYNNKINVERIEWNLLRELSTKYSAIFRGHNNIQSVQSNRVMQKMQLAAIRFTITLLISLRTIWKKLLTIFLAAFIPVSLVAHAVWCCLIQKRLFNTIFWMVNL